MVVLPSFACVGELVPVLAVSVARSADTPGASGGPCCGPSSLLGIGGAGKALDYPASVCSHISHPRGASHGMYYGSPS